METKTEKQLFDIVAGVKYLKSLGCDSASRWFVRQLIATGKVTHVRVGRKFYVSREAIDGWISKNERRAR